MAGMARHGSATAFSGFSVCQPALGAALQWLPAVGTPELDDMINAFLPGPASIQDKRAHISMDFFEYYRQTGENFKFYATLSGSFTPVTASPASSALYDSGYGSSFNHSPVLSDQGSWAQSPAAFAAPDARTKSRSSTSKRASSSADFASHPGMRILTKDGQDVTNSASRGCKTKEQRDHAHLMRIIKACDACRKKKIRCDPSHKKRAASQASTSPAEQKPAKKARKAEESPPVTVMASAPEFLIGNASASPEAAFAFPGLETDYPQDFDAFWNDFITFDQEPAGAAVEHTADHFFFDSVTDSQNFFFPSPGLLSISPSQVLTPPTPALSRTSPVLADPVGGVGGEVLVHDPTVPYLNPGVAHGTNYVDFNLYSPGPDVSDEDPVLQMVDLGSQQRSPQLHRSAASPVVGTPGSSHSSWGVVIASPLDVPDTSTTTSPYLDPGSSVDLQAQSDTRRSPGHERRAHRPMLVHAAGLETANASSIPSPVSRTASPMLCTNAASTVAAHIQESSVSLGSSPRPRRPAGRNHSPLASRTVVSDVHDGATGTGILASSATVSQLDATSRHTSSQGTTHAASPTGPKQSHKVVRATVSACVPGVAQTCGKCSVSAQLLGGVESGAFAQPDGRYGVQHGTVVLSAVLATIFTSTLPTWRIPAGDDAKNGVTSSLRPSPLLFQLAVLGLVSLFCASALQAHLGTQVNLANMLVIASLSLARFAPRGAGPSSVTRVASRTLPSPASSGFVNTAKLKVRAAGRSPRDLRSAVLQRAGNFIPRLASVSSLRL
ncbi:hypothetical protein BT67DRAFT_404770 [Trichocladium antarcticum]|uniref:Zn(2)-C6 fungal-type domain-containing protein n=1 Tax=Trichocladium antarcticum TaxID=1450529 RepID=A0AAN6UI86_9PEZI|nr:hypothetical protein BT67DRAFT_404770 [Trichocladium antarcticum]